MGGAPTAFASVAVGTPAVTGNGADGDGLGDGGGPRAGTFHEPAVVVAGGHVLIAELDGTQDADVGEATDDTLSPDGRAAPPGPLVAGSAHGAAKGGRLLAAGRAGFQGLGGHAERTSHVRRGGPNFRRLT